MADEARPLTALRKMPLPKPVGQRREWLARALFEGALIAVRTELQANRKDIARVVARNAEITARIDTATKAGRIYEGAILTGADLVSAAWDSVRAAAITTSGPIRNE